MPRISIDEHKRSTFHTILNHWRHNDKEPNFIDVICALRKWTPMEIGECAEIQYGNQVYYIERKDDK